MIDIQNIRPYIYKIVGILYDVHNELGPGLNENVYQEGLKLELEDHNVPFEKELSFHPIYKGKEMKSTYRLDFLINKDVIVELKSVLELNDDHRAQLFNYMHMREPIAGILINYAPKSCKVERYLYDKETKSILTIDGNPINHKRK